MHLVIFASIICIQPQCGRPIVSPSLDRLFEDPADLKLPSSPVRRLCFPLSSTFDIRHPSGYFRVEHTSAGTISHTLPWTVKGLPPMCEGGYKLQHITFPGLAGPPPGLWTSVALIL